MILSRFAYPGEFSILLYCPILVLVPSHFASELLIEQNLIAKRFHQLAHWILATLFHRRVSSFLICQINLEHSNNHTTYHRSGSLASLSSSSVISKKIFLFNFGDLQWNDSAVSHLTGNIVVIKVSCKQKGPKGKYFTSCFVFKTAGTHVGK